MKKLLVLVFVISMLSAMAFAAAPFKDVADGEWYYDDVNSAYEMGLINGKNSPETFLPNDNMTYAEAIKLAACMHQRHTEGKVTLQNGDPWYQPFVDYCKSNKIIDGDLPYAKNITRADYMVIFAKALPESEFAVKNVIEANSIPDVPESATYSEAVYTLYRAGIVGGVDEKHSCAPETNIKRSEVATILVRMMDKEKRISFTMNKPGDETDALEALVEGFLANFNKDDIVEEPKEEIEKDDTPLTGIEIPYQYDLSPYITIEESDYKGISLAKVEAGEVTSEDMVYAVESDLESFAKEVAITDRAAQMGDTMSIDFEGFIDGKSFEGGKATNYDMILGEANFIPGFEEQLVGHKVGETFTIDVTFPEDYGLEDLAGQASQFKIKINTITEIVYPELTDSFVKEHFGCENVNEYLTKIYINKYDHNASEAENEMALSAFETVFGNVTIIKLPEDMMESYRKSMREDDIKVAESYGMTLDELIEASDMTAEDYNKLLTETASIFVEQELVVYAIAKNEGLIESITVGELEAYIVASAEGYDMTVEEFKAEYSEDVVLNNLVFEKAIQFVLDNAVYTDVEEEEEEEEPEVNPEDFEVVTEYTPEALEAKAVAESFLNAVYAYDTEKARSLFISPEAFEACRIELDLVALEEFAAIIGQVTGIENLVEPIRPLYDVVVKLVRMITYKIEGYQNTEDGYIFKVTTYTPNVDVDAMLTPVFTQEFIDKTINELITSGKITDKTTQEEASVMMLTELFSVAAEKILNAEYGDPTPETKLVTLTKSGDKWLVSKA